MKKDKTKAYFIPHCEDETCDLGVFQYTCPHCNETISNYKLWFKQDDIWSGISEKFNCKKCNKLLTVKFDKKNWEYLVNQREAF